jgi:hypothetical protein
MNKTLLPVPVIKQLKFIPYNKWLIINKEYLTNILNLIQSFLKNIEKNNNIVFNYDKIFKQLSIYIYQTSFNKNKKYITY